jgi:methionyl-tRNA formyltransferase
VRILFLGTPEFAAESLRLLIKDEHFDIAGVVTQPDRPAGRKMQARPSAVKEVALAAGLRVYAPETVNSADFRAEVAELKCEAAAVVAFGQILGQKFIDIFPHGCANVHASLLPRWRGAAPIQRALMAGDLETGVSLQVVVKKLDAGDVLGIRRVVIDDEMDAVQLHDKLKFLGAELLHLEFMDWLRGNLVPTPQDESGVTHAAKIDKSEARIDWAQPARAVHNRIRGSTLGPYAYCMREGHPLKILRARALDGLAIPDGALPGTVIHVDAGGFAVACSQGALDVLDVQPESRSRQVAASYLRGYPVRIGDRLE